jgi:hypothetical protein
MRALSHLAQIFLILTIPPVCQSFTHSSSHDRAAAALSSTKDATPDVYPLSQRKALLIKEAERLDPSIAKDGKGESLMLD